MSLSVLASCPACRREFRVGAARSGRITPCPYCRHEVPVPEAATGRIDRIAGRVIGGFRLDRRLGSGAIGVVYSGIEEAGGRVAAIKLLSSKAAADPQVIERFQREARLCTELAHPSIVTVYACGVDRGAHYLAMELVDGPTLAAMLDDGALPWREALAYAQQIASALTQIHRRGIIHRDVKPANILIAESGVAKLADLGLAKRIDPQAGELALTVSGVPLGSPAYMPPEQILDASTVGPGADVYALGATLYHCLSGRLPYEGQHGAATMQRVLEEAPPPLESRAADLPHGVEALVARLMSRDPRGRPDCAQAERAIADLIGASGVRPRLVGGDSAAARRTVRFSRRSPRGWLLAIGSALAVLAIVAVWRLLA